MKKYLIKNIKDDFQWFYCIFRSPFPHLSNKRITDKHISLFKYWIWWEEIDSKRILENKLLQIREGYTIPWKSHRKRYKIINGLKWLSFLKEFEWMISKGPSTKFFQVVDTFIKQTTNLFSEWINEITEEFENQFNQFNQQNYLIVKLRVIEKLKHKKWMCLSNWKCAFLIKDSY